MLLKPYKKKLQHSALEGITSLIKVLLKTDTKNDDDKLHYAVLAEIAASGEKKLLDVRKEYTISFSPAQAIALRILATDYMAGDRTSHMGNLMHTISNDVHKYYQ